MSVSQNSQNIVLSKYYYIIFKWFHKQEFAIKQFRDFFFLSWTNIYQLYAITIICSIASSRNETNFHQFPVRLLLCIYPRKFLNFFPEQFFFKFHNVALIFRHVVTSGFTMRLHNLLHQQNFVPLKACKDDFNLSVTNNQIIHILEITIFLYWT